MADVFISYARKDWHLVKRLADALKGARLDLWIDRDNLPKGEPFFRELEKAIEDASCVIVCWTNNSVTSTNVYDEASKASEGGKLLPVRLQDVEPPFGLRSLQRYDLIKWMENPTETDDLERLIADVRSRCKPAIKTDPKEFSEFPLRDGYDKDFTLKLQRTTTGLLDELALVDNEFQFQSDWFARLQAQVEVRSGIGADDHRIADLLEVIETDEKTPIFLVLGDPGAGKSVALRQLARHGLRAASHTGLLPIYINLREWLPREKWSAENPPTVESLKKFVRIYLSELGRSDLNEFFTEYLGRLHLDGRIFWIFDFSTKFPQYSTRRKPSRSLKIFRLYLRDSFAKALVA